MKKIILLAFCFLICLAASAQITFEATGGYGKLQDVTYDAAIPNKLYALTQGNHIVVSLDNAATWNILYSFPNTDGFLSDLKLTPGNGGLSFATRTAIHIFDLSTETITATYPIPQSGVAEANPSYYGAYALYDAEGTTMIVNTGFSVGFSNFGKTFYTDDAGATWTEIYYTLEHDNVFINNVAISPSNAKILFLARGLGDSGVDGGLWISYNGGLDWTENIPGVSFDPIAFNPTDGSEIYAGSSIGFGIHPENLYKSADNGMTWEEVPVTWTDETLNNITAIVYCTTDPDKIIVLDENETVRTTDGGLTWTNVVYPVGLAMDYYYGLNASYNPFDDSQIAITTDFYPQFSADGGATLTQIQVPFYNIISASAVNYPSGGHLYYGAQGGRIHKDLTSAVSNAYDTEDPNSFNPKQNYIIADPLVPGRVFTYASMGFFGGFLNVSTDYGATTVNLYQAFSDDIQELTVDPANTNVIYVSMRSGEGGSMLKIDFTDLDNIVATDIITPDVSEFGEGVVTGIILNPSDPNEIYIAKKAKIFKSADGGQTWEEKTTGLDALDSNADLIWDFVKNPLNPDQFAIATNIGIFSTDDAAENWTQLLDGTDVKRIKYSPLNNGVIVGAVHTSATTEASVVYSSDYGANWTTVMPEELSYVQSGAMDFTFEGTAINAYIGTTDIGVIKYVITGLPLGVSDHEPQKVFGIYPNPASGITELITANGAGIKSVTVYSLLGQAVLESDRAGLDVSGLSAGTYIVKVITADGKTAVQKLIRQ